MDSCVHTSNRLISLTLQVVATKKRKIETLSRFNDEEANLTMKVVERLIEEIGVNDWVGEKITLGIITPYRAQVDHLQKLADGSATLETIGKLLTINTVDAFRGQERDVIVISFVRSNSKGEVGFWETSAAPTLQ